MMQQTLIYKDKQIPYSIRVSKRAKRIILKVSNEGEVAVTVPNKYLVKEGAKLAEKKARWIYSHLNRAEQQVRLPITEQIMFLGNSYSVELIPNSNLKLNFDSDKFLIHLNDHKYGDIREELKKFYIKKAKELLPKIVKDFGHKVNRIAIRGQKTRWGSCSSNRNLNFNWKLMMAPVTAIQYVVAHELSHLEYMNHSPKFWKAVEKLSPDYRWHRAWLKKNGKLLKF